MQTSRLKVLFLEVSTWFGFVWGLGLLGYIGSHRPLQGYIGTCRVLQRSSSILKVLLLEISQGFGLCAFGMAAFLLAVCLRCRTFSRLQQESLVWCAQSARQHLLQHQNLIIVSGTYIAEWLSGPDLPDLAWHDLLDLARASGSFLTSKFLSWKPWAAFSVD